MGATWGWKQQVARMSGKFLGKFLGLTSEKASANNATDATRSKLIPLPSLTPLRLPNNAIRSFLLCQFFRKHKEFATGSRDQKHTIASHQAVFGNNCSNQT